MKVNKCMETWNRHFMKLLGGTKKRVIMEHKNDKEKEVEEREKKELQEEKEEGINYKKRRVIMYFNGATSDDLDFDICCQGHPPK